jgi:hypothetical protein
LVEVKTWKGNKTNFDKERSVQPWWKEEKEKYLGKRNCIHLIMRWIIYAKNLFE